MKNSMIIVTVLSIGCVANVAISGDGEPQRGQDRSRTATMTLQQDQTRLQECVPAELKASLQDMAKARDQYRQQLRDNQKEVVASTDEKRDQLRDQLRDQIKEQAKDREQIRERLQELRESLPSHQELMEQAREQAGAGNGSTRRGE